MVAGLTCWGPPASDELVELWRTASDPERLGTTAYNNQALVALARDRGIAVWTVGNGSDCVWNPRRCGVLLGNSSSTQLVQGAELYFPRLGEPCTDLSCLTVNHDRVLEHPAVLDLIERVAGSPIVP
jgi:hypothetical protein